jgi:Flp pilus assembly pilin Flp
MLQNSIRVLQRSIRDEQGGEVIEYALILGLIIVICISAIAMIGTKVLARWGSVNSSL